MGNTASADFQPPPPGLRGLPLLWLSVPDHLQLSVSWWVSSLPATVSAILALSSCHSSFLPVLNSPFYSVLSDCPWPSQLCSDSGVTRDMRFYFCECFRGIKGCYKLHPRKIQVNMRPTQSTTLSSIPTFSRLYLWFLYNVYLIPRVLGLSSTGLLSSLMTLHCHHYKELSRKKKIFQMLCLIHTCLKFFQL